jgi:N-methylhydantoinase A/oxoprolinase/acetone carboxylase beta subunit
MSRYLVACDAGGTMTDVIIVDEEGRDLGSLPRLHAPRLEQVVVSRRDRLRAGSAQRNLAIMSSA